jgi:hypothetical protein
LSSLASEGFTAVAVSGAAGVGAVTTARAAMSPAPGLGDAIVCAHVL